MKKILLTFMMMVATISLFADKNAIYIDVPVDINIKDRIILVNKLPYTILQAKLIRVNNEQNHDLYIFVQDQAESGNILDF